MPPHPLTNFEIQKNYQNKPRFNGVYSRGNLPDKIKDGAYIKNPDEYSDIGTHWVPFYYTKLVRRTKAIMMLLILIVFA